MPFVDREIEMSALEAAYKNPVASLFVVYGRRRVGKTTLLAEFCKGKHQLKVLQKEFFVDVDRVMNVGDAQSDNFEVLLDSESHFTANIWKLF